MNRMTNIRRSLILFVIIIMSLAAFIGFFILILLQKLGIIYHFLNAPISFLILGLITAIILGTLLTIPFSKRYLKPIQQIIQATKKVGAGNFDVQLPKVKTHHNKQSEIAELTDNFNRMIKELSSIELLKKDFINNFSHEFKTPISSIIGFAKELQRNDLNDHDKQLYLSLIIKESERLSLLSSTILTLSKLETQTIITNKTVFRLDEQIRETILLLQEQWEMKNIQFSLNFNNIMYYGNKSLLNEIWLNIIGNAIKFSNMNGEIDIDIIKDFDQLKVIIKDNGIGMDSETLAHVFEQFYQADSAHSIAGNGLGLPLVKKIVELCQGNITITSQLHAGTEVTIILPIE